MQFGSRTRTYTTTHGLLYAHTCLRMPIGLTHAHIPQKHTHSAKHLRSMLRKTLSYHSHCLEPGLDVHVENQVRPSKGNVLAQHLMITTTQLRVTPRLQVETGEARRSGTTQTQTQTRSAEHAQQTLALHAHLSGTMLGCS